MENRVATGFGLSFRLTDPIQAIYRGFGMDLPSVNGSTDWTLPMPARFVIDRDGFVRHAAADPDYRTRPEPSQTLEALRAVVIRR